MTWSKVYQPGYVHKYLESKQLLKLQHVAKSTSTERGTAYLTWGDPHSPSSLKGFQSDGQIRRKVHLNCIIKSTNIKALKFPRSHNTDKARRKCQPQPF